MKFIPTIVLVIACSITLCAQGDKKVIINDVNINERSDLYYVEVVTFTMPTTFKMNISIWYGQQLTGTDQNIQAEDGKQQKFNSSLDALNFMHKQGWEYVNTYTVTAAGQTVYHYVLKRKE